MRDLVVPFLQSSMICLTILKVCQYLKDRKLVSSDISRKMIHTGIAIAFTLAWTLYPSGNYYSRVVMGIIPSIFAFQFTLIGIGFIHDPKTVNSMSRSGNPSELLKGPVTYGVIISLFTIYYWFDSPVGLISILILGIGDGFSAIAGLLYGKRKLPHNKDKSYVGTTAFFLCSFIGTYLILNILSGYFIIPVIAMVPSLFITCLICAFVESLPIFPEWDNITVSATSLIVLKLLGW